jgi:hypothetical protein
MKAKTKADVVKMSRAPALFVRFKSNKCPHCIDSQPEWNSMVNLLKGYTLNPGCVVGEIESALTNAFNATDFSGEPFNVPGFPTYEFFRNGTRLELNQPERDAASLLKALEGQGFIQAKSNNKTTTKHKLKRITPTKKSKKGGYKKSRRNRRQRR